MAPGEDVERGRASSAAERQKSIVSMSEFEGMDEYTALQKYILFYRDPRSGGHHVEEAPKKKGWQFWKSNKTAAPVASAGEVPDECKFLSPPHHPPSPPSAAAAAIAPR
jgi:H+-transporting ATPase